MAFSTVSLDIHKILGSYSFQDLRLTINSNTTLISNLLLDLINQFQFDITNKKIGIDSFISEIKSKNLIFDESIVFMDGSNVIGQISKSNSQSNLSIHNISILENGIFSCTSTGSIALINKLGIGLSAGDISENGLFVGKISNPVKSRLYGEVILDKQAVQYSTEDASNTSITTYAETADSIDYYYGELIIRKSSKQFIYLSINCADANPTSSKPIVIFVYEDVNDRPASGQSFTVTVKNYLDSAGSSEIDQSNWGPIYIVPGYNAGSSQTPVILNYGIAPTNNTANSALTQLTALSDPTKYISLYNDNITNILSDKRFGSSFTITKFENLLSGQDITAARFIITNSHNIEIIN